MNAKKNRLNPQNGFTFVELITVLAVTALCALVVLPSLARTRNTGSVAQCRNNLRQLVSAWTMYSADNRGTLVSAYPGFAGFPATWCAGNAQTGGSAGAYVYGGADPRGVTNGLLWSYIKSLSSYKCPEDNRVSQPASPFPGKPILRSVSMNSYMAGTSFGVTPTFLITVPGSARNPNTPVFLKENEISKPATTFVIVEEDPQSINDSMFLVDMGGTRQFLDLPSRLHSDGYGINFADGHVENIILKDAQSLSWIPGQTGGINDWRTLTNLTTSPLN